MASFDEQQPDAWQQNAIFTELLATPAAGKALTLLEEHLKPIFTSHAFYSLDTGKLTIKLQTLTGLLTAANILPHFTPHNFKLGLHLAIAPTLSQSASPSKDQPLHFDTFINAVAFCVYYYPPATDLFATPRPHVAGHSNHLDVGLETARNRLLTHCSSPRTLVNCLSSPATTTAFFTPRATFSDSFPSEKTPNMAPSPKQETWFTPAQFDIRTKLFQVKQGPVADSYNEDSDNEASIQGVSSSPSSTDDYEVKSKPLVEPSMDSPSPFAETIVVTAQLSEEKQNEFMSESCVIGAEEPAHVLKDGDSSLNVAYTNPPVAAPSSIGKERPEQITEPAPQEQEPYNDTSLQEDAPTVSANIESLFTHSCSTTNKEDKMMSEDVDIPNVAEPDSPDSASTKLSLARSTTLSELPSPGGSFQSPELQLNVQVSCYSRSDEPSSSRKLSFSDSDGASDTSSCYENPSDIQEPMTRIENAFADSQAVSDFDEEDTSVDLGAEHTEVSPAGGVSTDTVQSAQKGKPGSVSDLPFSLKDKTENDIESCSEQPTLRIASTYHSTRNENDASEGEAMKQGQAIDAVDSTHSISFGGANFSYALSPGRDSERGYSMILSPLVQSSKQSRFVDTDMNVFDDEDHTLLFDQGNESDGSELSMGTRETMSKMVEDYISQHGSASPYRKRDGRFIVEDQVVTSPDRESVVAVCDDLASETRQSMAVYAELQGSKVEAEDGVNRAFKEDVSAGLESQCDSFSSEITPDGLNVIKKQLVVPSPFLLTEATLGSSISSGLSNDKSSTMKSDKKIGENEEAGTMTVSVREKHSELEEGKVCCSEHKTRNGVHDVDMMRVLHETMETCHVLRGEVERRQHQRVPQISQENCQVEQWQRDRGCGRWVELVVFGSIVVLVVLVFVEIRMQRGVFLDVLV